MRFTKRRMTISGFHAACKFKLNFELLRLRMVILYRVPYRRRTLDQPGFSSLLSFHVPHCQTGSSACRLLCITTKRMSTNGRTSIYKVTDNCIAILAERSVQHCWLSYLDAWSREVSRGERTREVALLFCIRDDICMEFRVGLTGCRSIWARSPLRGYDFVVLTATNRALLLASLCPRTTNRCFFRTPRCFQRKLTLDVHPLFVST